VLGVAQGCGKSQRADIDMVGEEKSGGKQASVSKRSANVPNTWVVWDSRAFEKVEKH
jgi:hypothetical protein